jgi:hypothetical protein
MHMAAAVQLQRPFPTLTLLVYGEATSSSFTPKVPPMEQRKDGYNEMAPWRELMRVKGEELAKSRHTLSPKDHCTVKKADKSDPTFKWLGEVVDVSN